MLCFPTKHGCAAVGCPFGDSERCPNDPADHAADCHTVGFADHVPDSDALHRAESQPDSPTNGTTQSHTDRTTEHSAANVDVRAVFAAIGRADMATNQRTNDITDHLTVNSLNNASEPAAVGHTDSDADCATECRADRAAEHAHADDNR